MQNHISGYGLPKKIMLDASDNFISEKIQKHWPKPENRVSNLIIIPSPEQCTGVCMPQIFKVNHKNTLILNLTCI